MSKFKVGNRVRCIDDSQTASELKKDNIYTVHSTRTDGYDDYVRLSGILNERHARRFELVREDEMNFTKSDLKEGMFVRDNIGRLFMFVAGNFCGVEKDNTYSSLLTFADDLTVKATPSCTINMVYGIPKPYNVKNVFAGDYAILEEPIWTRPAPRKTIKVGEKTYYEDELSAALANIKPIN